MVDDEDTILFVLDTFLADCGHRVTTTSTVKDAIAVLEKDPPGLVITDIRMPGLDGLDLFRLIRERFGALPVIAITGHYDAEIMETAEKLGVEHFMEKPFSLDHMGEIIDGLSARSASKA